MTCKEEIQKEIDVLKNTISALENKLANCSGDRIVDYIKKNYHVSTGYLKDVIKEENNRYRIVVCPDTKYNNRVFTYEGLTTVLSYLHLNICGLQVENNTLVISVKTD